VPVKGVHFTYLMYIRSVHGSRTARLYTVRLYTCRSTVLNLLEVTFLAPRIYRSFLEL